MNEWLLAASVLLVGGLVPLAIAAVTADAISSAAALNLGGPVASLILLLISEGLHRQPFVDLAVVLAIVSFVGSVIVARFFGVGRVSSVAVAALLVAGVAIELLCCIGVLVMRGPYARLHYTAPAGLSWSRSR